MSVQKARNVVEIAGQSGVLRANGSSALLIVKYNETTSNPGVGNDSTQGYLVGSRWINTSTNTEYVCINNSIGAAVWVVTTGAASNTVKETINVSNSFSAGQAIYRTSGGYALSNPNNLSSSEVLGLIETASGSAFTVVYSGKVNLPSHGFTIGEVLFLNPSVPGGLTVTNPSTIGQISKPVAVVLDANNLIVKDMRGLIVSSTTQIQNVQVTVAQSSHGFVVGDTIRISGSNTYTKAQADTLSNSQATSVVTTVIDANNFTFTSSGVGSGFSGLTPGATYYLSASSAGATTTTAPTGAGQFIKPIFYALTTTTAIINIGRETQVIPNNVIPVARVWRNGSQTINDNISTKIQMNAKIIDNYNWFDSTTNFRYTPQLAGKYAVSVVIRFASNPVAAVSAQIAKNGSLTAESWTGTDNFNFKRMGATVFDIVDMNGSSDYIEAFVAQDSNSTPEALDGAGSGITFMAIHYIGA